MNKAISQAVEKSVERAILALGRKLPGTPFGGMSMVRTPGGRWIVSAHQGYATHHGSGETLQEAYTYLLHDIEGTEPPPF